tara:strand:- start:335 stop:706 length:372 start_codon:yes stop_codon:yes gene_type:complete
MNSTFASAPPAIDFAAYKKQITSPNVVEAFEKLFSKDDKQLPPLASQVTDFDTSNGSKLLDMAKAQVAESEERIAVLTKQINVLKDKRLSRDTTPEDIFAAYPEMEKEIEQEIEEHAWQKDIA